MDIELIVKLLSNDRIGVLPTDTVYGVVGRLLSEDAVGRIYEVKLRSKNKPVGTILVADTSQIANIVDQKILERANSYWPGPTSVILPVVGLDYAHAGWDSLPFRIPASSELVTLLKQTGPLATSSANPEGYFPATTLQQAKDYFGDTVDFYVDGGDLSSHRPSRIIELLPDGTEKEIRS